MTQLKKSKTLIYTLVLAFIVGLFSFSGAPVEAAAKKTKLKTVKCEESVGGARYYYNVTDLKVKKGGKKVKKIKVGTNKNDFKLRTSKYYYSSEKGKYNYKWKTTYDYNLYFLKAGTYTVTYNTYESGGYCSDSKGSYEKPGKIVKHTEKITVRAPGYGVKTCKLGSAIDSYSVSRKGFKTTSTEKYKPYLTSKKAKLTVTMYKGYKIKSIQASGYDSTGRYVTKTVKNKSKIDVSSYKSPGSHYAPSTRIEVTYKTPSGYTDSDTFYFYYGK